MAGFYTYTCDACGREASVLGPEDVMYCLSCNLRCCARCAPHGVCPKHWAPLIQEQKDAIEDIDHRATRTRKGYILLTALGVGLSILGGSLMENPTLYIGLYASILIMAGLLIMWIVPLLYISRYRQLRPIQHNPFDREKQAILKTGWEHHHHP